MTHTARFHFSSALRRLLVRSRRWQEVVPYRFDEHPAVKDAIEAMGVPHTEVDVILANGDSVGFDYQLRDGDTVEVFPLGTAAGEVLLRRLTPPAPEPVTFILDVHLGKLARRLRLLGFDSLYRNDYDDAEIIRLAMVQGRVILTRDKGILKQRKVALGCLVDSDHVAEQLRLVLARYRLAERIRPFLRCPNCNGLTEVVAKEEIAARLFPRTARYYEEFHRCGECGQVYWPGPHYVRVKNWLEETVGLPLGRAEVVP